MLYYTGLEEIIFNKGNLLSEEPDEIIIISGYLGPSPLDRISKLKNIKVTVYGGMYSQGIDSRLFNSLKKIAESSDNLEIYYSEKEIHSKIYIWKNEGKTLGALIGSANFTSNGLRTDFRESLSDVTRDTFIELNRYLEYIHQNSTLKPHVVNNNNIEFSIKKTISKIEKDQKPTANLSLYDEEVGEVEKFSGLNWGRAILNGAHTSEGDAYIRIPSNIIKENLDLIKPFDPSYISPKGKRKRNSDPIEIIWDDGFIMEASLEGVQKISGIEYPKNLSSYSSATPYLEGKRISKKSILGRYLRNRMQIDIDTKITKSILNKYGRNTITLTLIEEGVYYADFSI